MRAEYDFSTMKARKNPYASKLKKPVTMRLSEEVVLYFKNMALEARGSLSKPHRPVSARLRLLSTEGSKSHGRSSPNPPLNSDPARIVFRSLSSFSLPASFSASVQAGPVSFIR